MNNTPNHEDVSNDAPDRDAPRPGFRVPDGALWASAAVLAGLIMVQGARVSDQPAYADMAIKTGAYSMATTEAGDAEALIVVDDREDRLLIYTVQPGDKFELRASQDLAELFAGARAERVGATP